jgi:hypothetical protein
MNQSIGDKAAIAFAVGFYDALGAGKDIDFAYKLGCTAIRLEGIAEHLTPILLKKSMIEKVTVQPDEMEKNNSNSSTFTLASRDKLSERQRRKLEEKRADLEEEYHLLSEKLKRIRRVKVIETDPSVEFKLEQQIEEIQQVIISLEQKLDKIEQELS